MGLLTLGGKPTSKPFAKSVAALFGVQDPTLAIGASNVSNFTPNHYFINWAERMSSWDSTSGNSDFMITNGYVNASDLSINSGSTPTNFWLALVFADQDDFVDGKTMVMKWSGTGTMIVSSNGPGGSVDSTAANRVEFTLGTMASGLFQVQHVASSGSITDLVICEQQYEAAYDAGQRINPDYLNLIADCREVRFMDWGRTNHPEIVTWAERPTGDNITWIQDGYPTQATRRPSVPIEYMIEVCNRIKADMWYCFPAGADDNYVTQASTLIRDNLDSDLMCTYERSNEVWNFGFQSSRNVFLALANTLWPAASAELDNDKILSAHGWRTYQDALLIDTVYSGILSRRRIACNVQLDWIAQGRISLEAPVWSTYGAGNGAGAYVAPYTRMTHAAITSYFGTGLFTDSGRASAVESAYPATSDALIDGYLRETGATGEDILSIFELQSAWDGWNTEATAKSLKLLQYEGGTHMIHSGSQSVTNRNAAAQYMDSSLAATLMTDLYNYWENNVSNSDGPYMQFGDINTWNEFGQFSTWQKMDDTISGFRRQLFTENSAGANWWGDTTDHRHGAIS